MSSPKEPMEGPPVQTTHSVLPEPAIRIELDGRINFAMQQNDVPVIKSLVIDNPLDRALENLRVQVSGESGFCEPWEARLSKIPPQCSHRLRLVDLTRDFRFACPGWPLIHPKGRRAHETLVVAHSSSSRGRHLSPR